MDCPYLLWGEEFHRIVNSCTFSVYFGRIVSVYWMWLKWWSWPVLWSGLGVQEQLLKGCSADNPCGSWNQILIWTLIWPDSIHLPLSKLFRLKTAHWLSWLWVLALYFPTLPHPRPHPSVLSDTTWTIFFLSHLLNSVKEVLVKRFMVYVVREKSMTVLVLDVSQGNQIPDIIIQDKW